MAFIVYILFSYDYHGHSLAPQFSYPTPTYHSIRPPPLATPQWPPPPVATPQWPPPPVDAWERSPATSIQAPPPAWGFDSKRSSHKTKEKDREKDRDKERDRKRNNNVSHSSSRRKDRERDRERDKVRVVFQFQGNLSPVGRIEKGN